MTGWQDQGHSNQALKGKNGSIICGGGRIRKRFRWPASGLPLSHIESVCPASFSILMEAFL